MTSGARAQVFYRHEYAIAAHSFDTTRKAKWVADSLVARPISGVELASPALLSAEEISARHDPAYVEAVRTGKPPELATSQGFAWDAGMWMGVCASNGGAVAAARAALAGKGVAGSLSSGLHHARRDMGNGFCTFNGLALAAYEALDEGARRVLILDLDAHCGGGTHSFIAGDPRVRQLDVSVSGFDRYTPSGGNVLTLVQDGAVYLPAIRRVLDAEHDAFDLCLYNAGMDPFEGCDVGGLAGITAQMLADREALVFEWCAGRGIPVAFVLAGGYVGPRLDQEQLVALHRLTLDAAAASRVGVAV